MSGQSEVELEEMAVTLAASGQYRIQRRLKPRATLPVPEGVEPKLAFFVDVETTGLDHVKDEIIELAMVPFTYGPDGRIYEVAQPWALLLAALSFFAQFPRMRYEENVLTNAFSGYEPYAARTSRLIPGLY